MSQSISKQAFLAQLAARNEHNRQVVETLFLPLNQAERSWQPEPGEWSVDQCFQHLILSFEAISPNTAAALNKPEPANSDGLFRHGWLARKTMDRQFDPDHKSGTVKKFNPPATYSPDILTRWLAQQERLGEMIQQAAQADLQAKCWIIKGLPIRYNLGDYLRAFVSHDELHIDQANRVVESCRQEAGLEHHEAELRKTAVPATV